MLRCVPPRAADPLDAAPALARAGVETMPLSIAVLLVALLPVTAAGALTLGWWLHERVRPLVEPSPTLLVPPAPVLREIYDGLVSPHARRAFALEQAQEWSDLARADREQLERGA